MYLGTILNKILFRNFVSGKSGSRSAFSGETEEVRVSGGRQGRHLGLGIFLLSLYLRLDEELRRGSFSLIVFPKQLLINRCASSLSLSLFLSLVGVRVADELGKIW